MKHDSVKVGALVVLVVLLGAAAPLAAQEDDDGAASAPSPAPSSGIDWLSAYHFHLTASSIRTPDPRFNWDARFGGDVDLIDYGLGRVSVLADYAVIIGSQLRTIDPNQSAYHLAASASWRLGSGEVRALFDHVSRHLSDRANRVAIAWNEVGLAASARYTIGKLVTTVNAQGARVVEAAFVDYTWQLRSGVEIVYPTSRSIWLVGRGDVRPTLVDPSIAGRSSQVGGRVEGAVRLRGDAAAVEFFAAWERRVDPYPLERATRSWAVVGLRLLNK